MSSYNFGQVNPLTMNQQKWVEILSRINSGSVQSNSVQAEFTHTSYELCTDILNQVTLRGDVCVVSNPEWLLCDVDYSKINSITFVTDCNLKHRYVTALANKYNIAVKIVSMDMLLEGKINMKFDVVVGNPPYQGDQSAGNKTHSLWKKFTKRAIELSDDYVAFVTPSSWLSCAKTKKQFTETNFFHAEILPNETFNVGVETSYWVLNKKDYVSTTIIKGGEKLIVDLRTENVPQCDVSLMALTISRKLNKYAPFTTFSGPIYHSDLSKTKTTKFKYPIYNTTAQSSMFAKKESADTPNTKVIFSNCGAFRPELDLGVKGTCWHSHSITVSDIPRGESLLKYLDSNVIKFLNKINRSGGFAGVDFVNGIPKVDLSKVWADAELYKLFDLTKEEIQYVESNVK